MNVKAILKGWGNYIFESEEVEKVAKERAKECSKCNFAKKGTYTMLLKDYSVKEIEGVICGVCGCPLSTLLRQSEKKCKKWQF